MKNRNRVAGRIGIAAAVLALLAACASAPEPVPAPDEEYDQAKSLRSRIEEREFAQYAQSEYEAGESAFSAGETALEAEDNASAKSEFDAAIVSYQNVIRAGFRAIAGSRKQQADTEKVRADEIKADVAVADDYAAALEIYNQAVAAESAGDDETAAELYENAATLFLAVYEEAEAKRARALEALDRASRRVDGVDTRREQLETEARDDLDETQEEE